MKSINATPIYPIELTENSLYNPVSTYTVDDVAQDISGGAFKGNLLDKEGGTILATMTVSYVTDGTDGQFQEVLTIAELDTLIAAGTLPTYSEFFFSSDGAAANYKIWWKGPITVSLMGD